MRVDDQFLRRIGIAPLLLVSCAAFSQPGLNATPIDQAQQQVVEYLGKLGDLRCTEDVEQRKLKPNGNTEISARSQYDYFLLMEGSEDNFQLSESRLELGGTTSKHIPLLLSNGFSTLLLVFHPYYRNSFDFTSGRTELLNGRSVIPVQFAHIPGTRTPAALALRGREFPLEFKGTAWLDAHSGQVIRMEACLLHEMTDVGLRSLAIHVEYKPSPRSTDHFMLPALAIVDLETLHQHWRNIHTFHDYKFFSTDAVQDPNVKVQAQEVPMPAQQQTTPDSKEKP